MRGLSKKDHSLKDLLVPSYYGLRDEVSWKMDLRSLFNGTAFLTHDELNLKYGTKMKFLNYMSPKETLESNLVNLE